MTQEFFQSTLITKYIKYLLSYTPLPLYPLIEHNGYMIKGCNYIYRNKLLKCTKSGIFCGIPAYSVDPDFLYASDDLTVQDENIKDFMYIISPNTNKETLSPLVSTDKLVRLNKFKFAEYDLEADYNFGEFRTGLTQRYVPNSYQYDPETHKYLGEYLRLLRNQYSLDLMSLYNCYNCKSATNASLNEKAPYVTDDTIKNKKLILVPIKFNCKYTVALDSPNPVLVKAVIYKRALTTDENNRKFIANKLSDKTIKYSNTQFNRPFIFSVQNKITETVTEETCKYLQQFENYLYLAIQVPIDYSNTVVVLEGDYTKLGQKNISDISVTKSPNPSKITSALVTTPSLLKVNDNRQHAFSDKLIAYLLRNTIDTREYIDDNVANIETKINYNPKYKGMWDNTLRYILYQAYTDLPDSQNINKNDILGFVDLDIEDAVRKGYIKYGS